MTRADLVCLVLLLAVCSYVVGRLEHPKRPAREQFELGLAFVVRQLSYLVMAGVLVFSVWMALDSLSR